MVNVAAEDRIDVVEWRQMVRGVRVLGGEARARHVYAESGAEADVLAAWRGSVGDAMWVASKEEAIEGGWFGPRVSDRARARIGDVVAAAFEPIGVFQKAVDPLQWSLVGHHGSMTPAEQLVPLLEFRG
jgi:hypothetical protein